MKTQEIMDLAQYELVLEAMKSGITKDQFRAFLEQKKAHLKMKE